MISTVIFTVFLGLVEYPEDDGMIASVYYDGKTAMPFGTQIGVRQEYI